MRVHKRTGMPSLDYVQVFGERNSGTSFLTRLLQDNMRNPQNFLGTTRSDATPLGSSIFGYKHWFLNWEKLSDLRKEQTLFIVIYRNPYTWVRAMMDRPYALAKAIEGHSIKDLPHIKLVGHINGKNTSNESHPDTGNELTLFELRKLKIESFQTLKSRAHQVVYINLEELLESPPKAMQLLAKEFGSAFVQDLNLERTPPKQLVREYARPKEFSKLESKVLNEHIDWKTESTVGYEKGNYMIRKGSVC